MKEFNEEDIIVVSKTLPAIAPLCGLELAKIDDVVLAEFIRLGKTKYSNDDFALLIEKPKSLCEYIINHATLSTCPKELIIIFFCVGKEKTPR